MGLVKCERVKNENLFRTTYLLDVGPDAKTTQESNSLLGFRQFLCFVRNNQWEFRDSVNDMSFGLDKCWYTRCGNSRNQCVTTLVHIDFAMPSAPWLGRCEHTSTTTHVTESTLAGTMSTTAANTSVQLQEEEQKFIRIGTIAIHLRFLLRNTCNSTTSSP